MCLQDQRMAARATFRAELYPGGSASVRTLPDVSRALWLRVTIGGAATAAQTRDVAGARRDLPFDSRMSGVGLISAAYHSREQCGSMFGGPLFVQEQPGQDTYIEWLEMDIETYSAILQPDV